MGPISWGYIDMAVLLLLLTLMNLHSFCCPFSSSYHVFPFSTFAVIRQQSRESGSGWDVEWGRLRRPGWRGMALVGKGRGRRKRPLPASSQPPPLRVRRGFRSDMTKFLPVKVGVVGMWSGDACVALAGEEWRSWDEDEGDASVPSPPHPNPRPYGYEGASEAT